MPGADPVTVRPVRSADEADLERLQSHLPEPSPALLSYGVTAGSVLVTTGPADRPVGYLLAVSGEQTHLAELVVAPAYRREGRASALLAELFERLPEGQRVTLAVAPDNQAALALYREHGFEHEETRPDFFAGGAALLLAREA
ncbi:MAG: GNAT family N-acetyltransferase [Haloferacaceae archaeon]